MFQGPPDAQLELQSAVTRTASLDGAALNLGTGFAVDEPGQPMVAGVNVTALDTTSGNETYSLVLQQSADGSTGWAAIGAAVTVTATGLKLVKGFVTKGFVRLVLTVAGTTPSITYVATLNPLRMA